MERDEPGAYFHERRDSLTADEASLRRHFLTEPRRRTALILGGGGPAGIAWECGLLLGLRDGGVDLGGADRIVGTSAGSVVGTHLSVLGSVEELYASHGNPMEDTRAAPKISKLMLALLKSKIFHRSVEGQRRSVGKSALRADVRGEREWLARIAEILPKEVAAEGKWPERDLHLTSINAVSGQMKVWTRESGVPLATAVASSCAVPCVFPLVRVGDHAYMDGGIGSPTNATLARGFETVVIVDPLQRLLGRRSPVHAEQRELEAAGSTVLCFAFSDRVHALVGKDVMDSSRGQIIAELGREQGRSVAHDLGKQL